MSIGWDVEWFPVSTTATPLSRQRPFHWISMKTRLGGPPGNLKNFTNDHRLYSRRRYMTEKLPLVC